MTPILRKGYLYKQGAYFGAWNDRFFVLEGSVLKQFTDEDTLIPSYTIFLGSAVVEGVFTPASNEEAGHGVIYSLVVRWPVPGSDTVEETWGYMHLGSYEEADIQEWFQALRAMIALKIEPFQSIKKASSVSLLPQLLELPVPTCYAELAKHYNSPIDNVWALESSIDGMLYRINESVWRFNVTVPHVSAKCVWETIFSAEANAWEPTIKSCHASSVATSATSDTWTLHMKDKGAISFPRVGCQEPESGSWIVLTSGVNSFEWIGWVVDPDSTGSILTVIFSIPHKSAITAVIDYSRKMKEYCIR